MVDMEKYKRYNKKDEISGGIKEYYNDDSVIEREGRVKKEQLRKRKKELAIRRRGKRGYVYKNTLRKKEFLINQRGSEKFIRPKLSSKINREFLDNFRKLVKERLFAAGTIRDKLLKLVEENKNIDHDEVRKVIESESNKANIPKSFTENVDKLLEEYEKRKQSVNDFYPMSSNWRTRNIEESIAAGDAYIVKKPFAVEINYKKNYPEKSSNGVYYPGGKGNIVKVDAETEGYTKWDEYFRKEEIEATRKHEEGHAIYKLLKDSGIVVPQEEHGGWSSKERYALESYKNEMLAFIREGKEAERFFRRFSVKNRRYEDIDINNVMLLKKESGYRSFLKKLSEDEVLRVVKTVKAAGKAIDSVYKDFKYLGADFIIGMFQNQPLDKWEAIAKVLRKK